MNEHNKKLAEKIGTQLCTLVISKLILAASITRAKPDLTFWQAYRLITILSGTSYLVARNATSGYFGAKRYWDQAVELADSLEKERDAQKKVVV